MRARDRLDRWGTLQSQWDGPAHGLDRNARARLGWFGLPLAFPPDYEKAREHSHGQERHGDVHQTLCGPRRSACADTNPVSECPHGVHEVGQAIGWLSLGLRQLSVRIGSLACLITNRVYLPITPGSETMIRRLAPARSERSNRPKVTVTRPALPLLVEVATTCAALAGQPGPWQLTVIIAPAGARTVSSLTFTPKEYSEPAIRTTGKGCISGAVGEVTLSVSATTLESSSVDEVEVDCCVVDDDEL